MKKIQRTVLLVPRYTHVLYPRHHSILQKVQCGLGQDVRTKQFIGTFHVWTKCQSHTFSSLTAQGKDNNNDDDDNNIHYLTSLPDRFVDAIDPKKYDVTTGQRKDVLFDLHNGKPLSRMKSNHARPKIETFHLQDENFHVVWKDGRKSSIPSVLVKDSFKRWDPVSSDDDRIYWYGMDEQKLRSSSILCTTFDRVIHSTEGQSSAIRSLYQYGILLVNETPIDDNGASIAALASAVGGGSIKDTSSILYHYQRNHKCTTLPQGTDGPMMTLYGKVWSTNASDQAEGASTADSAYGHDALPLHTDMTYFRDPPGLQIFTMKQPATIGGESIFCDGFAAAHRLRDTSPDSFALLSQTIRTYRSIDTKSGWNLQATGPIISIQNRMVRMIRHNDLDILPDLPPLGMNPRNFSKFYDDLERAHEEWNKILAQDDTRLTVQLQPGETMLVANQVRCCCFFPF
jgi:Taurine catabolism dioxygenase TauD, TfdA family